MGVLEGYKPAMAMVAVQCIYAIMAVTTRDAMLKGMSSTVFLVYRQTIATLIMAPLAFFCSYRKQTTRSSIGWKNLSLIFVTALIGVTTNQNLYFEGILLVSSSVATAMTNLVPAITFLIALIFGLETVNIRQVRSIAKIVGTFLCIFGACVMTLLRGRELLNAAIPSNNIVASTSTKTWFIGCACLFTSNCCWSIWLVLQVKINESYPDPLSSSAWMCFMAAIQAAAVALCFERDLDAWILDSTIDIISYLVAGIGASAMAFFLQAWCISVRGPVFSALFNPVCTIVATIFAAILLKEEVYVGSFIGAIVIIIGLYTVLWGKAYDIAQKKESSGLKPASADEVTVQVVADDTFEEQREPLLSHNNE